MGIQNNQIKLLEQLVNDKISNKVDKLSNGIMALSLTIISSYALLRVIDYASRGDYRQASLLGLASLCFPVGACHIIKETIKGGK